MKFTRSRLKGEEFALFQDSVPPQQSHPGYAFGGWALGLIFLTFLSPSLKKAMKKSMVFIMPRPHLQSSSSKWYHSHPLTFRTDPTFIPVRRQSSFPERGDLKERDLLTKLGNSDVPRST